MSEFEQETTTGSEPEALCGMRRPDSAITCTEPAGHAGDDGRGGSHGDGSIIRWIYR